MGNVHLLEVAGRRLSASQIDYKTLINPMPANKHRICASSVVFSIGNWSVMSVTGDNASY